jgi:hypothetical protein
MLFTPVQFLHHAFAIFLFSLFFLFLNFRIELTLFLGPCHGPGGQYMWDFWRTKWHWDRFFPEYFGFPMSILFHRCSMTRKNEKKLIIFITGLHNKPQAAVRP